MKTKNEKTYDDQFREWWPNNFSNKPLSLNSFFNTLEDKEVQMVPLSLDPIVFQIWTVIEGDTLLVKTLSHGYCIFYPRHETFIKLIFPFEESYTKEMFKYTEDKL